MATVTLDRLWLHDAADLSVYETFFTDGWSQARSLPGEVRRYAGGRHRAVTLVGQDRTVTRTLRMVTEAQLEQLDAWIGHDLLLREHHGRLLFVVFFDLSEADYKDGTGYDVPVTFTEVTRAVTV